MSTEPREQDNPIDTLRYGWHLAGDLYAFLHLAIGFWLDVALVLSVVLAVLWANQTRKAHRAEREKRARAAAAKRRKQAVAAKRSRSRKSRSAA